MPYDDFQYGTPDYLDAIQQQLWPSVKRTANQFSTDTGDQQALADLQGGLGTSAAQPPAQFQGGLGGVPPQQQDQGIMSGLGNMLSNFRNSQFAQALPGAVNTATNVFTNPLTQALMGYTAMAGMTPKSYGRGGAFAQGLRGAMDYGMNAAQQQARQQALQAQQEHAQQQIANEQMKNRIELAKFLHLQDYQNRVLSGDIQPGQPGVTPTGGGAPAGTGTTTIGGTPYQLYFGQTGVSRRPVPFTELHAQALAAQRKDWNQLVDAEIKARQQANPDKEVDLGDVYRSLNKLTGQKYFDALEPSVQREIMRGAKEPTAKEAEFNDAVVAVSNGAPPTNFDSAIQKRLQQANITDSASATRYIAKKPEVVAGAQAAARQPFQITLMERRHELGEEAPPTPGVTYIDRKTGREVHPETKGAAKDTLALKGPEQKEYLTGEAGLVHLDLQLDMLDKLGSKLGSGNRLAQNVKTSFNVMKNEPTVVAFVKTLEPFSATAISAMASAGGGGAGGRSKEIQDRYANALANGGDSLATGFAKTDTVLQRNKREAVQKGLGTEEIDGLLQKSAALQNKYGIKPLFAVPVGGERPPAGAKVRDYTTLGQ